MMNLQSLNRMSDTLQELGQVVEQYRFMSQQGANIAQIQMENPFEQQIIMIGQGVQNMFSEINQLLNSPNIQEQQMNQVRQRLSSYRVDVRHLWQQIREFEDSVLYFYRTALGPNKQAFEALSTSEQQMTHPQAFFALQQYYILENLYSSLHKLNGDLMDISQSLEQAWIQQQPERPVHLNQQFDQDPTPHTLSP
jgi:hypothetical protein